jgi:hypothetical protein
MVNNAISFLLAESPQSGPFAVEEKDPPGILLSNGFRVVTRPTACEPLRDHSPLRVEVVTKLSQWGN